MRTALIALSILFLPATALAAPSCPASIAPPPLTAPTRPPAALVTRPPVVAEPVAIARLAAPPAMTVPLSPAEIAEAPALQRIASHGAQLFALPARHGLRAVFARNGNEFRVFYITPDGQAEIGGVMWDATGHNITRDQVAGIPGVIPTVHLTSGGGNGQPSAADVPVSHPEAQLSAAHFGLEGAKDAPRVYMVMDPLCPYSIQAYKDLSPYVTAGKVQLALVPISINDHENDGASTPAALEMLSAPQTGMGKVWSRIIASGHADAGTLPSDDASASLALNMATAHGIELRGTPTFVWTDRQGEVHEEAGAPDDLAQFVQSLQP